MPNFFCIMLSCSRIWITSTSPTTSCRSRASDLRRYCYPQDVSYDCAVPLNSGIKLYRRGFRILRKKRLRKAPHGKAHFHEQIDVFGMVTVQ